MSRVVSLPTFDPADFASPLLTWFKKHHRRLPWRADPAGRSKAAADAYHVLVSEAMLQQTQVATVVGYFQRFIEAFPTVQALAAADEQSVLRRWQGLGYYRRARHLHAAARQIVDKHGGLIPRDVDALLALPGVGRYTAGAVASIAFGVAAPVLDGNVARVLARWFALDEPVDAAGPRRVLWALAERLVEGVVEGNIGRPGTFNEALMELGATVCTPRQPKCDSCPVAATCQARLQDRAGELPRMNPRRRPRDVVHHVIAIEKGGRFLFVQRPFKGLWSRMWQLPTVESDGPHDGMEMDSEIAHENPAPRQLARWIARTLGPAVTPLGQVNEFVHQTTHRTIRFKVWRTAVRGGRLRPRTGLWRRLDAVDDLPLANPQRRAIAMLEKPADKK